MLLRFNFSQRLKLDILDKTHLCKANKAPSFLSERGNFQAKIEALNRQTAAKTINMFVYSQGTDKIENYDVLLSNPTVNRSIIPC